MISEATQEGKIAELMLRFRTVKDNSDTVEFMDKSKELVDAMLDRYQQMRTMV